MRASRLALLLVGLAIVLYLIKNQSGLFGPRPGDAGAGPASPIERARAIKAKADSKAAESESASREAESAAPQAAGVTENMTPDQVRTLLGPPDEVQTSTADNGRPQETWTYRRVGKTVVFENGVAVSIR
jgi:hypothetical protein